MTDEEHKRLLDALSDQHTTKMLQETMKEPKSAEQLTEICDISPQSVYRRTDKLTALGLMETEKRYDPDGHHFTVFRSVPTEISVVVPEDGVEVAVSKQETMADRFTEFITGANDQ